MYLTPWGKYILCLYSEEHDTSQELDAQTYIVDIRQLIPVGWIQVEKWCYYQGSKVYYNLSNRVIYLV